MRIKSYIDVYQDDRQSLTSKLVSNCRRDGDQKGERAAAIQLAKRMREADEMIRESRYFN